MAEKKLKIFIHSMDGAGHINASVGIAQELAKRGHEITFIAGAIYSKLIVDFGFKFVQLIDPPKEPKPEEEPVSDGPSDEKPKNPFEQVVKSVLESGMLDNKTPLKKFELFTDKKKNMFDDSFKKCVHFNPQIKAVMDKEMPDLFIVDNFMIPPIIFHSKVPWIFLGSVNPLSLYRSDHLPPFFSGMSTHSDPETWTEFQKKVDEFSEIAFGKQNELLRHFGGPEIAKSFNTFFVLSDYLNIYGYPEELDYHDIVPRPKNFIRVDAFCRESNEEYKLPDEFKNRIKPGDKLIYFSLGSMGSFSVPLMKSIIKVLAKTPHKYIVSLGPLHAQYELPDNIYGEQFLPQTAIIPMVDLVITHGGNNTVTETFNFGKPMIVMPLFADQYDNAQRVQEKGFGIRINPFEFDENFLIESIDKLLSDTELNAKLCAIPERIRQSKSKEKACIAIEQMVQSYKDTLASKRNGTL